MSLLVIALTLATLQATPPQANDVPALATTQPTVAAEEPASPTQERIVCRRERQMGSNLRQRVCMTEREWNFAAAQSREDFDRARNNAPPENIDPTRRD